MKDCVLLFLLTSGICIMSQAQNIIPNGSFERMTTFGCPQDPITGFTLVDDWNSGGTPHLWINGCPYDRFIWSFWDPSSNAIHGLNSIGLTGSLFVNGEYNSVAMNTKLSQPMDQLTAYYFQFQVRNRGVWHRYPDSLRICSTDPPKRVQVYFGTEELMDPLIFSPFEASLTFTDEVLQSPEWSDWMQLHECFDGFQGSTHMALSSTRGATEMSPPCEIRGLEGDPNYFIYHFDYDDLILYPIPDRLDTSVRICDGAIVEVDLIDMARVPQRVPIEFEWEDGFTGSNRAISSPANYVINAKLPCASFLIEIEIIEEECVPMLYVPNMFSPNGDGINDFFGIEFEGGFDIRDFEFTMYDRWGNVIWEMKEPSVLWDGRVGGSTAPAAVYTWSVSYVIGSGTSENQVVQKGDVTLVR